MPPSASASATADAPAGNQLESAADAHTRDQLAQILARSEFREFADRDSHPLVAWLERLFRSFEELDSGESSRAERAPEGTGTISPIAIMALALVALCLLAVYVASQRPAARAQRAVETAAAELPSARAPSSLFDEAGLLAARGDLRGALRVLYLTCLVALDRGRLIEYETHKTNGQYLRGMTAGPVRDGFAAFTRVFDRTFYGRQDASAADYAACRALAEQILAGVERPPRGPS